MRCKSKLDREMIATMHKDGISPQYIAVYCGCALSQLYRERPGGAFVKAISKPAVYLTSDEVNQAIILYKEGTEINEICKILNTNVHPYTLRKKIKESGVKMRLPNETRTFDLSETDKQKLVLMYKRGLSPIDLSEHFKASSCTIRRYLKSIGILTRNRNEAQVFSSGSLLNHETKEQVIILRKQGLKTKNIANRLGLSDGVIRSFLSRTNKARHP